MAETKKVDFFNANIFTAIGVLVVLFSLIIPMPLSVLNVLMAFNLVFNLLILLMVLFVKKPTDFSVFPSLLLVSTVFGLGVNVSSTRLILTLGRKLQGTLINAFSSFVVGSSGNQGLVVGFTVFIILIAVQAFVITKGATRIAEVAARFTLDFNATKSMSIDAEYNAGVITEEEARRRKKQIQREADFFGAMDGASKFVSGNVKIGIFITMVNIIAGLITGMVFGGETFSSALETYTKLTIGDGLLSQLPSLLISIATGFIVTRSGDENSFGEEVKAQFAQDAWVYFIGAGTLLFMAFLPGFPHFILFCMAILFAFLGWQLNKKEKTRVSEEVKQAQAKSGIQQTGEPASDISPIVPLDPLSLELGYALIPLVDKEKGAELLSRIKVIRKEAALDLGLVAPKIRIIDNMRLEPGSYCFKIQGLEVARGKLRLGWFLAIKSGVVAEEIPGERTTDPTFGLPAIWISEENRDRAERAGYTVVAPSAIIATHLTQIIRTHAADILGRQNVQAIIDALRKDYPAVIDDVTKKCPLGKIQKVLQGLLREQVSIRNTVAIFETLADYASNDTVPIPLLIEKVRQRLGRQICLQYVNEDNILHAVRIDPALEADLAEKAAFTVDADAIFTLSQKEQRTILQAIRTTLVSVQQDGYAAVLLVSDAIRASLWNMLQSSNLEVPVLSFKEISADMQIETVGVIRTESETHSETKQETVGN
ncbi:flagellar biosynthesis protein FlhA [Treponema phagedenis]|uniref:flagellar biosynthesis protein FlhA n=1 Tax=Treponema phagedenis TaxID=162 RepID=UPI0001F63873|nr:flagellar biosynthesis protein FlhA [Treponema phagedenis]EFW36732.1 flagellar biosynthesis protein FlhA [Treponema phagedenis F0421]TYT78963.1 flagellar biosynthesis protein FlhA [Treponema phagedenis]